MLDWKNMTRSQWMALILGFYELIIAAPTQLNPATRASNQVTMSELLPAFFFQNNSGIYFFATFSIILGLQRIGYATIESKGDKSKMFFPWVCLVLTHVVETMFWYATAMNQPRWQIRNSKNMGARDMFLTALLTLNSSNEGITNFILLCGVPLTTISFAFWGP